MAKAAGVTSFCTVRGHGEARTEISRSVFIGCAERVESEAEANAFIARLRQAHPDATHVCTAYVTGQDGGCQRADDDGEPTGTAGKPLLEVLKKQGLRNVVVVVIRYFGGVKLGAGGLIRAYGKMASAAVAAAGCVVRRPYCQAMVVCDYALSARLEANLTRAGYVVAGKIFAERVTLQVLHRPEDAAFEQLLADWSSGTARIRPAGVAWVDEDE